MNEYEELAANIIDTVSEFVVMQHPEIKFANKITREIGLQKGTEALICGSDYYDLESGVAQDIEIFCNSHRKKIKLKQFFHNLWNNRKVIIAAYGLIILVLLIYTIIN
jgi:hypothetical protein